MARISKISRRPILLGVNIDHVATVRQARRGFHPDPAAAAREAVLGGADQITIHLREDRRHIQDRDLVPVRKKARVPINLEMALNPKILKIALAYRPDKVCIVPERRQELTTEGGLDAAGSERRLKPVVSRLRAKGIQVSLFIAPEEPHIRAAARLKAHAVELHTGTYAEAAGPERKRELEKIREAAALAHGLGLIVHAGHGLDYQNVKPVCRIPEIEEVNIGHSIVARALTTGIRAATREMKDVLFRAARPDR